MDEQLLINWKLQYKNVYCATLGEQDFYFRALTLEEIDGIDLILKEDDSSADLEDFYVKTAVLYPQNINWDKIKAGYITSLAEEIKGYSGLSDVNDIINSLSESRENLNLDVIASMKAFTIAAMPFYAEEDLNKYTIQELIHKVVMAERILSIQQSLFDVNSTGVQFAIYLDEPQKETKKTKGQPAISREELLRRIRQDERGMTDVNKLAEVNHGEFENLDEDLLLKAAGVIKSEDPIARKLREAMGG